MYQTDVLRNKAVASIEEHRRRATPLYLSLMFVAPHGEVGGPRIDDEPYIPLPRGTSAATAPDLPRATRDELDVRDKPPYVRGLRRASAATAARIRADFRSRRESLIAVDAAVEAVVGALARTGRLDSTYILFTSDNGFFQGEHKIAKGKYLAYDPSSHVPLLVRGPGSRPAPCRARSSPTPTSRRRARSGGRGRGPPGGRAFAAAVRARRAPAHAPPGPARGAGGRRHRPRRRARAAGRSASTTRSAPRATSTSSGSTARASSTTARATRGRWARATATAATGASGARCTASSCACGLRRRRLPAAARAARRLSPQPARLTICWRLRRCRDSLSGPSSRRCSPSPPCPPPPMRSSGCPARSAPTRRRHDLRQPGDADLAARGAGRPARHDPGDGPQERPPQRPAARALRRPGRELRARAQAAPGGAGHRADRSADPRHEQRRFHVPHRADAQAGDDPEPDPREHPGQEDAQVPLAARPRAAVRDRQHVAARPGARLPVPEPEVQARREAGGPADRRQPRPADLVPPAARHPPRRPTSARRPTRASRC